MIATRARIGFSHASGVFGILSRIIMWFTRGIASHCFVIVEESGVDVVYEATDVGFRAIAMEEWLRANVLVEVWLPVVPIDPAMHLIKSSLGRPYDFGGLLAMGWVESARRIWHRSVNNPLQSHRALFCSEVVADVLQAVAYPGASVLADYNTDPMDLRRILAASGAERIFPTTQDSAVVTH